MENVGDLAENEASLVHAGSLNKKTVDVILAQMRHMKKLALTLYLSGSQSFLLALSWTVVARHIVVDLGRQDESAV